METENFNFKHEKRTEFKKTYGTLVLTSSNESFSSSSSSSWHRWYMLILLSILSGLNQGICYSYAPIATTSEMRWNSKIDSTELITIYFITYIPASFIGSYIMDYFGLRTGVLVGAWLQSVGTWIRYLGSSFSLQYEIYCVVTGQIIASLAMPFMVNSPPLLSNNWFELNERTFATSTAVNGNAIGIAFVYFIAPNFVDTTNDLPKWELILAIITLCFTILATFTFKSYPSILSSPISRSNLSQEEYNWKQWFDAFRHTGFGITVFVFSIGEVVMNAISTLLNKLLIPEGYTKREIGVIGGFFIISCLCGSQIICYLLDKTKQYKCILLCLIFCSFFSLMGLHLSMSINGQLLTVILLMISGFFIGPIQSITQELGVECSYPTSETTVAALQQLCGNFLSALLVPLMSSLRRTVLQTHGHIDLFHFYAWPEVVMAILFLLSGMTFLFFNGKLKRTLHKLAKKLKAKQQTM